MGTSAESMPHSVAQGVLGLEMSEKTKKLYAAVAEFMEEEVFPAEEECWEELNANTAAGKRWTPLQAIQKCKDKAKAKGLWNFFLPPASGGGGLTNFEYAPICELTGRSHIAPEVFNCNAPDSGNMEILSRFATPEQKARWLEPLLEGEIRSCFGMTEPAVASSDATNIESLITTDGDDYIINGTKWWTSGAGDPRCKLCIFMGKTDPSAKTYNQQSMLLVSMDTPGITILRPLSVYGFDDAPHGHMEVVFENVRVNKTESILLGEGRGFEIAQARLGPGRVHHCMRLIGAAERALELMVERVTTRKAFGKMLVQQSLVRDDIAECRMQIDQARLLTLHCANAMDNHGNKITRDLIAMIKVVAPRMACSVIDKAVQTFGGMGVCQDTPLAGMWIGARSLRLADGPDEVHKQTIAMLELGRQSKRTSAIPQARL